MTWSTDMVDHDVFIHWFIEHKTRSFGIARNYCTHGKYTTYQKKANLRMHAWSSNFLVVACFIRSRDSFQLFLLVAVVALWRDLHRRLVKHLVPRCGRKEVNFAETPTKLLYLLIHCHIASKSTKPKKSPRIVPLVAVSKPRNGYHWSGCPRHLSTTSNCWQKLQRGHYFLCSWMHTLFQLRTYSLPNDYALFVEATFE